MIEILFGSVWDKEYSLFSMVYISLILCGSTFFKVGVLGRYVIIISHRLYCSSEIFYIVNLYYKRSGRRSLLFLNKGIVIYLQLLCDDFYFVFINFSFPLSLNFIGEIMILIGIFNWNAGVLINLILICFFRRAYSLYLFSYVYHEKNIYYENNYNSDLKEYMI